VKLAGRVARPPQFVYFALLVMVAFLAEPSSFFRDWNEGRAAIIVVVPLLVLEMGSGSLRPLPSIRRSVPAYSILALSCAYYVVFAYPPVRSAMISSGVRAGVDPLIAQYSWVWGLDYAATSVFILALLVISKSRAITPLIYTVGMSSFLYIDVLLPFNSLGPFAYVVPPALEAVAAMVNPMGIGSVVASGNMLALRNAAGTMNLVVFWPSAGLDGIVIGLLVVVAMCVKLGTGWVRGAIYLAVGAAGSFLVNLLRIVLLVVYAFGNITDPKGFEAFHSVAGELVFLPWIVLYLLMILKFEGRIWSVPVAPNPLAGTDARTAKG
jgi:thaumarchaeosortase